jgi:hypothetical protein
MGWHIRPAYFCARVGEAMAEAHAIERSGEHVEAVQGEIVRLQQSQVERVDGEQVQLVQSIVGRSEAGWTEVDRSIAQLIDGDTVHANRSVALALRCASAAAEQSALGAINVNDVTLADCNVGILIGRDRVRAANVNTLVFVGHDIDGQVHTVFDTRGAALLGLAIGAVLGVLSLLGGLMGRRR